MRADLAAKIAEAQAQVEAEKPKPKPEELRATEKLGVISTREGENIVSTEAFNRTK